MYNARKKLSSKFNNKFFIFYFSEIVFYLNKSFENFLKSVQIIQKEDLELVNHLSGKKGKFIKLTFKNIRGLQDVKTKLVPLIEKNKKNREMNEAYEGWTD